MLLLTVLLHFVLTRFDEAQEWAMELEDGPLFIRDERADLLWPSAS